MSVLSEKLPLMVSLRGPVQLGSEKQGTGKWCQGMAALDVPLPCATRQSPCPVVLSSRSLPPGYLVPAADLPRAVASGPCACGHVGPVTGLYLHASMLWNEKQAQGDRSIRPHPSLGIHVEPMVAEGGDIFISWAMGKNIFICLLFIGRAENGAQGPGHTRHCSTTELYS